jgi:cobalt/nickel transport protein
MTRQNILLLFGVVLLTIMPMVLIRPATDGRAIFGGSDDHAAQTIAAIRPDYERWVSPLWEPPSSEIATLLFGVQAAFGAGAVAYCLGYYRGRRRAKADDAARN